MQSEMLGKKIWKLLHEYLGHVKVNRAFFGKGYCIVAIASIFYVIEYEEISKNSLFLEIFLDVLIHPSILFL